MSMELPTSLSADERREHQLRVAIDDIGRQIAHVPDELVIGARGEKITREEAGRRAAVAQALIDRDEVRGSLRHRIVTTPTKVLTLVFLVLIDLPVMLWLVSSVFNVDWSDPVGLPLVISVVVSLLGTAGAAWVLHHMGHNRREYKNDRRELDWSRLSLAGRVSLIGVATLVLLISVVMFLRVFTEGQLSGLNGLAVFLAVLVALIMLLSAALVFFTAFRDGSPEQEDLAHYSRLYGDGQERRQQLEKELAGLEHELRVRQPAIAPTGREPAGNAFPTDAQVRRIDEVRPPQPPGRDRTTDREPSGQGRTTPQR
jgi:hypothetical protein